MTFREQVLAAAEHFRNVNAAVSDRYCCVQPLIDKSFSQVLVVKGWPGGSLDCGDRNQPERQFPRKSLNQ